MLPKQSRTGELPPVLCNIVLRNYSALKKKAVKVYICNYFYNSYVFRWKRRVQTSNSRRAVLDELTHCLFCSIHRILIRLQFEDTSHARFLKNT